MPRSIVSTTSHYEFVQRVKRVRRCALPPSSPTVIAHFDRHSLGGARAGRSLFAGFRRSRSTCSASNIFKGASDRPAKRRIVSSRFGFISGLFCFIFYEKVVATKATNDHHEECGENELNNFVTHTIGQ